jgi:hypothetical protein
MASRLVDELVWKAWQEIDHRTENGVEVLEQQMPALIAKAAALRSISALIEAESTPEAVVRRVHTAAVDAAKVQKRADDAKAPHLSRISKSVDAMNAKQRADELQARAVSFRKQADDLKRACPTSGSPDVIARKRNEAAAAEDAAQRAEREAKSAATMLEQLTARR